MTQNNNLFHEESQFLLNFLGFQHHLFYSQRSPLGLQESSCYFCHTLLNSSKENQRLVKYTNVQIHSRDPKHFFKLNLQIHFFTNFIFWLWKEWVGLDCGGKAAMSNNSQSYRKSKRQRVKSEVLQIEVFKNEIMHRRDPPAPVCTEWASFCPVRSSCFPSPSFQQKQ